MSVEATAASESKGDMRQDTAAVAAAHRVE